ncbi:MAG: class IV adenylate cyclase [Planctomycetales bacterium]|nr:class IV adenylate cyclase [Planctomycetales bacterium]
MQFEVERKFWVNDFSVVVAALTDLGSNIDDGVEQVDQYFAHPSRDFVQTDEVFRLRNVGDANFVTYKGARIDSTTKTRHELELPLGNGAQTLADFESLLTLLGFTPIMTVRKFRRKGICEWEGTNIEVCLDEIDQLGTFVELEATTDARGLDDAKERLASLAERLELTRAERRSYLELLQHQLSPPTMGTRDSV